MGLRPSEAHRANVGDWSWGNDPDGSRDVLTVRGKGGRVRYLPADVEVARLLRQMHAPGPVRPADEATRPFFPNPKATNPERRRTKEAAYRVMKNAIKRCGLAGAGYKPNEVLRHAFATDAVNRQVPLDRVGAYLGHTDQRTTRRYAVIAAKGLEGVTRK